MSTITPSRNDETEGTSAPLLNNTSEQGSNLYPTNNPNTTTQSTPQYQIPGNQPNQFDPYVQLQHPEQQQQQQNQHLTDNHHPHKDGDVKEAPPCYDSTTTTPIDRTSEQPTLLVTEQPTTTNTDINTPTTTTTTATTTPQPFIEPFSQPETTQQHQTQVIEEVYPILKPKPIPGLLEYQHIENQKAYRHDQALLGEHVPQDHQPVRDNEAMGSHGGYQPRQQPSQKALCGKCKEPYPLPAGSTSWRCKKCGEFQNLGARDCSIM